MKDSSYLELHLNCFKIYSIFLVLEVLLCMVKNKYIVFQFFEKFL